MVQVTTSSNNDNGGGGGKGTPAGDEWVNELKFDGYRMLFRGSRAQTCGTRSPKAVVSPGTERIWLSFAA
jgi:hypothetical protein